MTKIQRFSTTSIFLKIVCAAVFIQAQSFAQEEPARTIRERQPSMVSFEAVPFFSTDSSLTLVNVHYRIREDFFVVLRNIESLRPNDFVARGDILIELHNDQGVSVNRDFRSIVLRKNRIPREHEQPRDLQGSVSLKVPPGTYTILFSVEDRQSERFFTNKEKTVTTRLPRPGSFDVSRPVFVSASVGDDSTVFTALNRGSDVLFGGTGGILHTAISLGKSPILSVRYKITLRPDISELGLSEFLGGSFIMTNGIPTLLPMPTDTLSDPGHPVYYSVHPAAGNWKTIYIPLPLEKLHPGRAHVTVDFEMDGATRSFETSFRVIWPAKPSSLRDLDLAVDALQHIASDEEMSGFRTFSKTNFVKRFFEFWKTKDPDTTTAYNELMVEYYRRVDEANRQYSIGDEINGYKTDRGRIYVLYGSPAESQRLFSPSGPPKEVWTYTNVKRRFIFEDRRHNGNYILVSVEDL